nr:hypothetical protein [Tanacetum cinerariifolium]
TPSEPIDSLSMGDEHLDIILATKSDEFIKSCVENLVPNPKRLLHDDPIPLPDTLDFSNVVRVFLPFFTYPVTSSILHPFGNEDTIFDPGITINCFCSFKPGLSHRCRAFKKFNTHRSHLNEWPMIINGKNIPTLDVILFYFYPLDRVKYGGNWVKHRDLKQALRGRHPMLISS